MKLFDVYPLNNITISRALGSYVWDDQGNQYLDMYGGHAVISIGHTHPHWVKKIEDQLKQIAFYSNSVIIPLQQQLAEKLGKLSGKTDYELFLCNSGAEANENALKLASFHTGRKKIIAFKKASLQEYFEQHGETIAAVITEGIQGVGGINIASDDFLQAIRQLCDQYGSVFIADSVQCGYGRTGRFFAHDHAGVDADIYSMAKGMGNGFPIGGILIAPHIRPKHGMLGTTFGGNHLACAAALAVLEIIEQEDLMKKAMVNGSYIIEQLKAIPDIQNVRGRGWMIGFDVPDAIKDLKKVLLSEYKTFTGEAKPNVIRLLPSLALNKEQVDDFLQRLREAIKFIQTANPSS